MRDSSLQINHQALIHSPRLAPYDKVKPPRAAPMSRIDRLLVSHSLGPTPSHPAFAWPGDKGSKRWSVLGTESLPL